MTGRLILVNLARTVRLLSARILTDIERFLDARERAFKERGWV